MGAKNSPTLRDDPDPIPLVRNNNAIYTLMATALANMKGGADIVTESLADFVDGGTAYSAIQEIGQDQFYKALIACGVKHIFTDEAFIDSYEDPFYLDSREFGGIVAHIHAEAPAVQASHAWNSFVSGTTQLGQYTIFTCLVSETLFGLSSSYELPVALNDEQMADCFTSEESLAEFTAYLMVTIQNALKQHRKDQSAMNRANWIGEKIAYAGSVGATGCWICTEQRPATLQLQLLNSLTVQMLVCVLQQLLWMSIWDIFRNRQKCSMWEVIPALYPATASYAR